MAASEDSKTKQTLADQEAQIQREYALRQFMTVQNEIRVQSGQIATMEIEKKECEEVLKILNSINNPERRCWYSIDGTLVEMNIREVLPRLNNDLHLKTNDIQTLTKQVEKKQSLLAQFAIDSGLTKATPKQRQALAKEVKSMSKTALPSISE